MTTQTSRHTAAGVGHRRHGIHRGPTVPTACRSRSPGALTTRLHQRAIFLPKGLAGQLYWYSLLPLHGFTGMLDNIAGASRSDGA